MLICIRLNIANDDSGNLCQQITQNNILNIVLPCKEEALHL